MFNPLILVAAAGASSRMRGGDKLLEMVQGKPLIAHQIAQLTPLGPPIWVALPSLTHPRAAHISGAIPQVFAGSTEGLSGTLRDAVAILAPQITHLLVCLPDLVDLTTADYAAVMQRPITHPDAQIWRGAAADGTPGHPVLFHQNTFIDFADIRGDAGAAQVVKRHKSALIALTGHAATRDLDTPEDWAHWRASQT